MTYLLDHKFGNSTFGRGGVGMGDAFSDTIDVLWNDGTVDQATPDDAVTTTVTGTGLTAADFTQVGGVCKPANLPAITAVKAMQLQMNRLAKVKGFGTISADGSVGPATLALMAKILPLSSTFTGMADPSSCINTSADSDVIGPIMAAYADSIGAPAASAAGSAGTLYTKTGKKLLVKDGPAGDLLGGFSSMSTIEKVAVVAALGGVGYMLFAKKPKRARTSRR